MYQSQTVNKNGGKKMYIVHMIMTSFRLLGGIDL